MTKIVNASTLLNLPLKSPLGDFWSWASSDVISNTNRGVFAEYLVAHALALTHKPRIEWDRANLIYGNYLIEVKSSAFVQSWSQPKPSVIRFDIAEKRGWDSVTNKSAATPSRCAHCYVFALHCEKIRDLADALDINQWQFFVLTGDEIGQYYGGQKSLRLASLRKYCVGTNYAELRRTIDSKLSPLS